MGFLPDIALAQTGNAVVDVAPGRTGAGNVENIDGEVPEGSFEQLLDAAVSVALQDEAQGGESDLEGPALHVDDVAILSLLQPETATLVMPQAKAHGLTVGAGEGAVVFQSVPLGSLGRNAETAAAEVSRVATMPVASQLAPVDAADERLVLVQTAVARPPDGKAAASVTPAPQQVVSTVLAPSVEGLGKVQPQGSFPENTSTLENQTKPVTIPVSSSSSDAAQKMTAAIHVATANHVVDVAKGELALSTAAQKMTTAIHVATGHVVETPNRELALSTALAGSHDESDEHPHPQGKPFVITKPQAGFVNVDTSEAESLLPTAVSGVARDVKVSEPDMVPQPARIDPQKTLGMTPVENVLDARGVSHVNRGPLTPMTDMSDGIQRVEQAMKMSAVTNQQGVRLQLDPPDLGRLVVNLNVHDQRVTTAMITDHPLVRDILVANQHRLESSLQEQGLRMQEFSVDLGRRSLDLGGEASRDGGTATGGEVTDDSAEETPADHGEEHTTEQDGLNLFA